MVVAAAKVAALVTLATSADLRAAVAVVAAVAVAALALVRLWAPLGASRLIWLAAWQVARKRAYLQKHPRWQPQLMSESATPWAASSHLKSMVLPARLAQTN
ncbi:hypothetical protein D3C86_1840500 [compost metagenome]